MRTPPERKLAASKKRATVTGEDISAYAKRRQRLDVDSDPEWLLLLGSLLALHGHEKQAANPSLTSRRIPPYPAISRLLGLGLLCTHLPKAKLIRI
jgi:hypothetical protein